MKVILSIFLLLVNFSVAAAVPVDYMELSALLVRDGNYSRAKGTIEKIDTKTKSFDWVKYHQIKGLYFLGIKDFKKAKNNLLAAKNKGSKNEKLGFYLAQVSLELGESQQALKFLQGAQLTDDPRFYLLSFRIHNQLKRYDSAYDFILLAKEKFPNRIMVQVQLVDFLLDRNLRSQASEFVNGYLRRPQSSVTDHLLMASLLQEKQLNDSAAKVLQQGLLKFPKNEKMGFELAVVHVKLKKIFAAYQIFSELSRRLNKYNKECAELAKGLELYHEALWFNAKISDQNEKLRQRLSILIAMEKYESATAMTESLNRLGLLDADEIRYALAFASFHTQSYQLATNHLAGIRGGEYFEKANTLRKAIVDCQADEGSCVW